MRLRYDRTWILFVGLGALLFGYILIPILSLIPAMSGSSLGILADPETQHALATSLISATVASAVMIALGVPLSYILARSSFPGRSVVNALILLPLMLPPLIGGILIILIFGPYAPIGGLFMARGQPLVNSLAGIILAQVFVASPFLITSARAAFEGVDARLEGIAATLGSSRWETFWSVTLPLARFGLLAGVLLAWMRALGEFGATMVMAYHPYSLPVLTWVQLSGTGLESALPLAALSVVAGLGVLALLEVAERANMSARYRIASEARMPLPGPDSFDGGLPRASLPSVRTSHPNVASSRQGSGSPLVADFRMRLGTFSLQLQLRVEQIVVLFGPSGAGKSISLQALAGLLRPEAGRIASGDRVLFDSARGINLPPSARRIGLVPQDLALFPHLTVRQNIGFGLRHLPDAKARVDEMMAVIGISEFAARFPAQLSGGQQQRVALARALAPRPDLLLLDEPFSALDLPTRMQLRHELRELQREFDIPMLFVTHDLGEAHFLADKLVVIDAGRILQEDRPGEILRHPGSLQVARAVGVKNILPGIIDSCDAEGCRVSVGDVVLDVTGYSFAPGALVHVCLHAERIMLVRPERPGRTSNALHGQLIREMSDGFTATLYFRSDGCRLRPEQDYDLQIELPIYIYERLDLAQERQWTVSMREYAIHLIPQVDESGDATTAVGDNLWQAVQGPPVIPAKAGIQGP